MAAIGATTDLKCSSRDFPFVTQAVRKRFPRPKDCTDRVRSPSTRPFEHVFAVGRLESILAQPRAMLSDRNGDTARATAHGPHSRIAARSGLIPTMFITRVRL